ncbi:MAG: hypothetical protein ICV53_04775 [Flavisolibacter sp.]|nr:hypothetical protein [Flavisolibacter sp.]
MILRIISFFCALAGGHYVFGQSVTFTIDKNEGTNNDNFGASGAWFSEDIGKYWPAEKVVMW